MLRARNKPLGRLRASRQRVSSVLLNMLNFEELWDDADTYDQFAGAAEKNRGLWEGVYSKAEIPEWAIERLRGFGANLRLLIIAEDWCGDAANTVPVLAKLGVDVENVDARIIKRDEHPDVMDRYLTNGARSIPIAIVLDEEWKELGHWGPRPRELQQWVMENKDIIPKEERYPQVRRWYAKDKGESILRELIEIL